MSTNSENMVNIVLNQWSLTIQVAVLCVFTIIFFALKRNSKRKVVSSWFYAWSFDTFALIMVMFVLFGGEYFSKRFLDVFYTLYSITKVWFSIFLFIGLFQLLKQKELLNKKIYKALNYISIAMFIIINLFKVEYLLIQICVYLLVGSIFFIGSLFQLRAQWSANKFILVAFMTEGILFLHHGIVLIPVYNGGILPYYMTHISFIDAIMEMVIGITCLFAIARKVNQEMQIQNSILVTNQSTLRKLVDVDPLTGLWHRKYFETFLKQNSKGATLVYLKVTNLEAINNEWGYAVGDLCLKETAKVMRDEFSKEDGLFRLGGNTFLVIMPNITQEKAVKKIQKFKNSLAINTQIAPILTLSTSITTFKSKPQLEREIINKEF